MGDTAENICHIDALVDINRDIAEVHRRLADLEAEFDRLHRSRDDLLGMLTTLDERKRALLEGRPLPVFRA